jgi:ribosomal protein S18 acetylase RimI-like enzyme
MFEQIKIKKLGEKISESYLEQLVKLHKVCFPNDAENDEDRRRIIEAWNAPPIMQYWVAIDTQKTYEGSDKLVGYIRWVEHGGIRKDAVLELEQIGVSPEYRGLGIGTGLIDRSIEELSNELKRQGRRIKLVYVCTGDNNLAQKLYSKTLGAKPVATLPNFYEDSEINVNEVIMLARIYELNEARKRRGLSEL